MRLFTLILALCGIPFSLTANEIHVSVGGMDNETGSPDQPLLTIQAAANMARAGDTVTVHEGVYRERVDPPRGGINDLKRILYRAATGEKVIIKGSEIVSHWEKAGGSVWTAAVPNSWFGDYNPYEDRVVGDWYNPEEFVHHTGEVFINGTSLFEQNSLEGVRQPEVYSAAVDPGASRYVWYSEVGEEYTTFWANFQEMDPNRELVEINVREACFYPGHPGVNYITVRGFEMSQAATQWAAPTAEQIGLIGTHWSCGWIIEDNVISNSKSVGITLGKDRASGQNVWMNNPQKDGATHYNEVIFRALESGWSREKIGSHLVRNNVIHDCGQAGIVGSLGAVFSTIHDNHIYNIYTKRTYTGAEMAGIKIHASIDMLIEHNRIHNAFIGIWLDWMAQGTRVTRNILYDNSQHDFFSEVNHGPTMVDHNLFLTDIGHSIQDVSEGGAYVHNLFAGRIKRFNELSRVTPYHLPHSTRIMALRNIRGGDNRFFNNIFIRTAAIADESIPNGTGQQITIGYGLKGYEQTEYESMAGGNLYYNGASPMLGESNAVERTDFQPRMELLEQGDQLLLELTLDDGAGVVITQPVTTLRLGSTLVSEAVFEQRDGSPYGFESDFSGNGRNSERPAPGPFESMGEGTHQIRIW